MDGPHQIGNGRISILDLDLSVWQELQISA
jgi:hypothetical protein